MGMLNKTTIAKQSVSRSLLIWKRIFFFCIDISKLSKHLICHINGIKDNRRKNMTNLHSNTIEAFTIFVMIMISIMVIAKHIITKVNLRRFLVHKRSGSVGNIRNSKQGFCVLLIKFRIMICLNIFRRKFTTLCRTHIDFKEKIYFRIPN